MHSHHWLLRLLGLHIIIKWIFIIIIEVCLLKLLLIIIR